MATGTVSYPNIFLLNLNYQKGTNIVAAEPWLTLVESFQRVGEEIAISESLIENDYCIEIKCVDGK